MRRRPWYTDGSNRGCPENWAIKARQEVVPKNQGANFVCVKQRAGTRAKIAGGGNDAQPQQRVADRSATEGADRERSSEDGVLFSQTRRAQIERRISFSYSFFYINQSSAQSTKSIDLHYITKNQAVNQASTIKKQDRISITLPRFRNQASGVFFDKRSS